MSRDLQTVLSSNLDQGWLMKEVNDVDCFKFGHMASLHFTDQKYVLQPVC